MPRNVTTDATRSTPAADAAEVRTATGGRTAAAAGVTASLDLSTAGGTREQDRRNADFLSLLVSRIRYHEARGIRFVDEGGATLPPLGPICKTEDAK